MHLDRRLIGWGLFFIILGAVPLAVRAGVIGSEAAGRWLLLWPLLLVGWGLGLVLRRTAIDWIGGAVTLVTLGLMGGGLIATGFGGFPAFSSCGEGGSGTAFATQGGRFGTAARMNVEFDCGTVNVTTAVGSEWQVSGIDSDGRGPELEGGDDAITLRTPSEQDNVFRFASRRVAWNVTVPRDPLLDFGLTLNAGQSNVDLAGAHLESVRLTVNAGSLRLALNEAASVRSVDVTLNAGNATLRLPAIDGDADVSLNAGNLTACLPEDAVVRLEWSGALAANDLDSSGLVRVDDDTWTSGGFDAGRPHLELRVSANAGRFGLEIGGSCDA
ncbi:MAG TPA: hypothetical protein VEX41_05815 [Candidatus Eisenbacteria bacterium]|nr:hypothetical protein [Candidatus Eisenbacteria bacterium]